MSSISWRCNTSEFLDNLNHHFRQYCPLLRVRRSAKNMSIKLEIIATRPKKIIFTILISFGVFSICSCKDKFVVEREIKVEVTPIKVKNETPPQEMMTSEFLEKQFAIIKSEETVEPEKEVKNLLPNPTNKLQ